MPSGQKVDKHPTPTGGPSPYRSPCMIDHDRLVNFVHLCRLSLPIIEVWNFHLTIILYSYKIIFDHNIIYKHLIDINIRDCKGYTLPYYRVRRTLIAVYLSTWWATDLIKCSTVYGSYAHNMANNVTPPPRFWPLKKPTMALIPCYFIERRSQAYRNNLIQFIITGALVSTPNYKHPPGVIRW